MRPLKAEVIEQLRGEGGKLSVALASRLERMTRTEYRAWLRAQRKTAVRR